MPKYVEKPIDEFYARSRDGSNFLIRGTALYRPEADDPVSMEMVTSDGRSVHRIEKGVYQIADTGEILRSDDAHAL